MSLCDFNGARMKPIFIFLSAVFVIGCGSGGGGNGPSEPPKPPVTPPTEIEAKWDETNWDESDWT